jgi:hypothetical protein
MRAFLILAVFLSGSLCRAEVPFLDLGRPLPNGCVIHAMLYRAHLDPSVGSVELVKVVGGGGVPHVIAVVSTPEGVRYGRDEDLGVFALRELSPQAAYDRARQAATATDFFSRGTDALGVWEQARSLRAAFERLEVAGFNPERVGDVVVWRMAGIVYVYSPARGCAEVRTWSRDLLRIVSVAWDYWIARSS